MTNLVWKPATDPAETRTAERAELGITVVRRAYRRRDAARSLRSGPRDTAERGATGLAWRVKRATASGSGSWALGDEDRGHGDLSVTLVARSDGTVLVAIGASDEPQAQDLAEALAARLRVRPEGMEP